MAAKRVVYLSYLFTLLIINLGACFAYRTTPKGPSETFLSGGERWSSSNGDFGMTEVVGIDLDHNGHNGAALGGQGAAGTAPGASVNGVGIGFGSGGGIGIGGSGGIGIGSGGGVGIGMGGGGGPKPEQPKPPSDLDQPKPPSDLNQPKPPIPPIPDPEPEPPAGPGIGIGGGGGSGIGIGKHRLLPPNRPTGRSTECQADKPIRGQLTGLRCQPLDCRNGDCGVLTMYFGTSTSTSDEDKLNKNDIHNTATAMTPDPDHVHDQMMMGNMESDKNAKNGQYKTVEAEEPAPDYSQMMSNKGSWTGLVWSQFMTRD